MTCPVSAGTGAVSGSAHNGFLIDVFMKKLIPAHRLPVMKTVAVLLVGAVALAAWLVVSSQLRPERGHPADQAAVAREDVAHGGRVRLETLLADAERRYPGRVIEVEFDDDDDEYEIEILLEDGRVAELVYDARTGQLLDEEIDDD